MRHIRRRLTYANVMSTLAVFLVLGGGTALASYVITSNADVGPDTISGHSPPAGDHANVIGASLATSDLAPAAVTGKKIAGDSIGSGHIVNGQVRRVDLATEPLYEVAAGSTTSDACADPTITGIFCSEVIDLSRSKPWTNYGGGFATAAFYKDQLGIVHLRGLVKPPFMFSSPLPSEHNIFRLPAGFRPASQEVFSVIGQGNDPSDSSSDLDASAGRVDVKPNGMVVLVVDCRVYGGSPNWVDCSANRGFLSLSGVAFQPG